MIWQRIRTARAAFVAVLMSVGMSVWLSAPLHAADASDADRPKPHQATIFLLDPQGKEEPIGTVRFSGWKDGKTGIAVDIDSPRFTDQFLSMRPFRCLEGKAEWFCYLVYPYKLKNIISRDDLRDLSYQLLFIRKKPAEFGIDAWNGLYYELSIDSDNVITGQLMEGDLNSLASPPETEYAYPIDLDEFVPGSKTKRLYPGITIR